MQLLFNIIPMNFPTINFSGARERGTKRFYSFDRIIRDWKKREGREITTARFINTRENKNITIGFKFSIAIDEAILFLYTNFL